MQSCPALMTRFMSLSKNILIRYVYEKCDGCDVSPLCIYFKHLSRPAQPLIGVKGRQVSLPVERNTPNSVLLNHTEEGAEGGRLGDELCTHAVLVSLSIHAQSGITKLLLLRASNQQQSSTRCTLVNPHHSYLAIRDMNNYRVGSFIEALKAHKQAVLSAVTPNITAYHNQMST